MEYKYKAVAHSDIGIRKHINEDSAMIQIAETDYGQILLALICDGMGGLSKGEVASATVIRGFSNWFQERLPKILHDLVEVRDNSKSLSTAVISSLQENKSKKLELIKEEWNQLLVEMNRKISQYGKLHHIQLGTTAVVLLIIQDTYYLMNIGDSRAYLIQNLITNQETIQKTTSIIKRKINHTVHQNKNQITQLTKDHTYIQHEMDKGRMTYEESLKNRKRNCLTQCIGINSDFSCNYYLGNIVKGSEFLLCSDGFRNVITKEEIYQYIKLKKRCDERDMMKVLVSLVELNKKRKEIDNITAVLIAVQS
ncbi:MAG: protein phosphatase 2C domain-containing protein [Eubacteriales bacterium]